MKNILYVFLIVLLLLSFTGVVSGQLTIIPSTRVKPTLLNIPAIFLRISPSRKKNWPGLFRRPFLKSGVLVLTIWVGADTSLRCRRCMRPT